MDRANWLLINYSVPGGLFQYPLGLGYISATLKRLGFRVICLDLAFFSAHEYGAAITSAIIDNCISVVGISGFSNNYAALRSIVDHVRSHHSELIIVGGGHIVSSDPEFIYEKLNLDYGVFGEGEETVASLAQAIVDKSDLHTIAGLIFRDDFGTTIKNTERKPSNDIHTIPWPDWQGWQLDRYLDRQDFGSLTVLNTHIDQPRNAPILLSRSCPYACTFCSHSISTFRKRSFDDVFAEIDALVAGYQINGLDIYDDLFAVNIKRVEEFCRRIKPYGLHWMVQLRADRTSPELLALLRDAGCYGVSYGFESMSQPVLDSMKKRLTTKAIVSASRMTYDAKVCMFANFIFSDAAETAATADETLNWWAHHRHYAIALGNILIYPGTRLYAATMRKGAITDPETYIRIGFPHVNPTVIPEEEFLYFARMIQRSSFFLNIPAPITKAEYLLNTVWMFNVEIICPHCGVKQTYHRVFAGNPQVMCRHCFGKCNIQLKRWLGRRVFLADQTAKLQEAIAHFQARRYTECGQMAMEVVSKSPIDWEALTFLASAQMITGRYREAHATFLTSLALEGSQPIALNNFGVCLVMTGQAGWGQLLFLQSIAVDPNNGVAKANADLVGNWLQHTYKKLPFVSRTAHFPEWNRLGLIPLALTGNNSSPAVWDPLRIKGSHPSPILLQPID